MAFCLTHLNSDHIRFFIDGFQNQTAGHRLKTAHELLLQFIKGLGDLLMVNLSFGSFIQLELGMIDYFEWLIRDFILTSQASNTCPSQLYDGPLQ